ncbi:MAG: hypothetical protein IJM83_10510 [Firmicutes bacterium]|nr:hypothetical protein [Bacillota bacterium]
MNIWIIIGIVLGAGVILTNRFIRQLPNWLAIVLYTIAVILILVGMIISRMTQ